MCIDKRSDYILSSCIAEDTSKDLNAVFNAEFLIGVSGTVLTLIIFYGTRFLKLRSVRGACCAKAERCDAAKDICKGPKKADRVLPAPEAVPAFTA